MKPIIILAKRELLKELTVLQDWTKCPVRTDRGAREQGSVKALVLCSAVYTNHEAVSKTNDAVYQVV